MSSIISAENSSGVILTLIYLIGINFDSLT